MVLNSAQMAWSDLNAPIKLIRLYRFEVTFLFLFIELGFEVNFSIQQVFHSSGLLDVHGTVGVSWQSDVIHLVFEILKLGQLTVAISLNCGNDVWRGSNGTHS